MWSTPLFILLLFLVICNFLQGVVCQLDYFDSRIFNVQFYSNFYYDLQQAFGNDLQGKFKKLKAREAILTKPCLLFFNSKTFKKMASSELKYSNIEERMDKLEKKKPYCFFFCFFSFSFISFYLFCY